MASSIPGVIGWGSSDGELTDATETRWSTISRHDVVGGATPLVSRGGIHPTGGNPLKVAAKGTPAMAVAINAGSVTIPGNSGAPPFALTLLANDEITIATSDATHPRIDLIIAEVYSDGLDAIGVFRVLPGTPASTPSRPTMPSGDYHAISLGTVTVGAGVTTITAGNVTKTQSDTWALADTDALYTTGPGGTLWADGVMAMSATRRQALAALYATGTGFWDGTGRVHGVIAGGDFCPTNVRTLSNTYNSGDQGADTLTPDLATHSSITLIGGTRQLQVVASVVMRGTAHAGARAYITAMEGPYLTMEVEGPNGDNQHTASRSWFLTASGTIAAGAYKMQGSRDGGSGTVTFSQRKLQIIDHGPA